MSNEVEKTVTNATTAENGQNGEQSRTEGKPPTRTLPSDRLAFDKQVAVLRAFTVVYESNGNKPVGNDAAGEVLGMAGSTVVVTNAFFCDVRLLVRQKEEQAFVPTPEALAYHKAYEWDPATAAEKLKPVFERGWFSEVLVPRLKFRAYEEREALSVLAEASGASKKHEGRLKMLLDYMVLTGVVAREGGLIKAVGPTKMAEPTPEPAKPEPATEKRELQLIDDDHDTYTLVLDPKRKRKVVVQAPHFISKKELDRISAWLAVQLIVEEDAPKT
ncbi:MAG TPA: hypothetical protein VJA21_00210 [Verrucomicrobiae bacterium]